MPSVIRTLSASVARHERSIRGQSCPNPACHARAARYARLAVTAKEKLRIAVEKLSEDEAAEFLDLLRQGDRSDSLNELLDNAPFDDEPETTSERDAVEEGRAALRRGDTVALDEFRPEPPV